MNQARRRLVIAPVCAILLLCVAVVANRADKADEKEPAAAAETKQPAAPATESANTAATGVPHLVIDQDKIHLGIRVRKTLAQGMFELRNTGNAVLEITQVRPG